MYIHIYVCIELLIQVTMKGTIGCWVKDNKYLAGMGTKFLWRWYLNIYFLQKSYGQESMASFYR